MRSGKFQKYRFFEYQLKENTGSTVNSNWSRGVPFVTTDISSNAKVVLHHKITKDQEVAKIAANELRHRLDFLFTSLSSSDSLTKIDSNKFRLILIPNLR